MQACGREVGKGALRVLGAAITTSNPTLETSSTAAKDGVGRNADGVLDAEELAELIKKR